MKIAVASSGLGHIARGIETWADELACTLHQRGLDVALCKGAGPAVRSFERVIACRKRASPGAFRWLPKSLSWRLGLASPYQIEQTTFALHLLKFLCDERIGLLHVQDPYVAAIAQYAGRIGLIPTRTILAHGTGEDQRFLAQFSHVQHLSPFAAGPWHSGCAMIPNFVDENRFHPGRDDALRDELGVKRSEKVVLCVSAIKRHHKRIDYLLDEFAQQRRKDSVLVIAGGREADTDELISHGKKLLGDRVRFLVDFPRERMPGLYRAADVFVLCSLAEMMPLALVEAAASGLPCLAHDHPVMRWMLGRKLLDMSRGGALAAALSELPSSSREHCLRNFSRDKVVDRIVAFYRQTMGQTAQEDPHPEYRERGQMTVSVVIPTFNSAHLLPQAIDSALAQTTRPGEIIVVDDGSTDDTPAVIRRYGESIRYFRQSNQGVAAARNLGLQQATGEAIAFLDADDAWHPRKLELQLQALAAHPEIGLIGTASFDYPGEFVGISDQISLQSVAYHDLVLRNRFVASSVVARRSILQRVGGFDPILRGPEDYDLWLRIARVAGAANVAMPLTGYRRTPGSLSRRPETMEIGLNRIGRKVRRAGGLPGILRRKMRASLDYTSALMYADAGKNAAAMRRLARSLFNWPLPLGLAKWARVKRLAILFRKFFEGSEIKSQKWPLRIVHIVFSLDSGGLERVVLDLLGSAKELGQEATVVCLQRRGELGDGAICLNKPPGFQPRIIGQLTAMFRKLRPDVVHTHQLGALLYAGLAARLAGIANVVHSQHGRPGEARRWFALVARLARKFFCVSVDLAVQMRQSRIAPKGKIAVVPNGIDVAAAPQRPRNIRAEFCIPHGVPLIGCVARLSPVKNQSLLIGAMSAIAQTHLLLVGDGPERERLEQLSHKLGLQDRVHFAGFQMHVDAFLQAMDIFALPSHFEGIPLAVLEAFGAGVPVVASRVGGLPEIVLHEQTGLLFEPGDSAGLTQALTRLLADASMRQSTSRQARELLHERFTRLRMARTYHDHYLRIAA